MKKTTNGTALSPVVDIFPQLCTGFHDRRRIRKEMGLLADFGFDRVYFVTCGPGYPQFSNPWLCLMPPESCSENHAAESIFALGDPNFVYVDECHRSGMEAFAIVKPYEGGGGSTVPHGSPVAYSTGRIGTIGGDRIHFGRLLQDHPELRVARKPIPDYESLVRQPVTAIQIAFIADTFTQRVHADKVRQYDTSRAEASSDGRNEYRLFMSSDNGAYQEYKGALRVEESLDFQDVRDANGFQLFDQPKRCRNVRISGFSIPDNVKYLAVTIESGRDRFTIPQSMIRLYGPNAEIPCVATPYIRTPSCEAERTIPVDQRIWGREQMPVIADSSIRLAVEMFSRFGFEFEWHGSGFWGDGFKSAEAYGIAKGKLSYMKGTPCEAYEIVREYWIEEVRSLVGMGYDGVDLRLQNHSGMVSDYAEFGYNEPIVARYQELYGDNPLDIEADPLNVMKIRGDYFLEFAGQVASVLHGSGRTLQIHLRHCMEEPRMSAEFNELGFWAMPKVLLDWRKAVGIADEITLKHYYHNRYRPEMGGQIKALAKEQEKRVWAHCYIAQGRELNEAFISALDDDPELGGILFYEVANSTVNEKNLGIIEQYGQPGLNTPVSNTLEYVLQVLGYG